MKEFKLVSWPELPPPYHRTAYRRALSNLSQRYLSAQRLAACSGLPRTEVRSFLDMLAGLGVLVERERALSESVRDSWKPISVWLRRQIDQLGPRF